MKVRFLAGVLGLSALAASATADGVRIVDAPGVVYSQIQEAIDAAVEGDVLLVAEGTYQPFTIDGLSLSVVAMPGATANVTGTVTVENLGAEQMVQLVGMNVSVDNFPPSDGYSGLVLSQNAGHVLVRDGVFAGGWGAYNLGFGYPGGHGILAVESDRVVIIECTLVGGRGGWGDGMFSGTGGPGGDGLRTHDSGTSIHAGSLKGGVGGEGQSYGGQGGHGYRSFDRGPFASGSTFQGGQGGEADPSYGWTTGGGGHGMLLTGPAELLACTLVGGTPGTPYGVVRPGPRGQPLIGPANVHAGIPRPLSVARIVSGSSSAPFEVTGVPGEQVALLTTARFEFLFVPRLVGTWIVPLPLLADAKPTGVVSWLGVLAGDWPTPDLRSGRAGLGVGLQAVATAGGAARLSDPAVCTLLDRDAGPDCNLNGVNDFLDIVEGTSTDVDGNLIPDDCETNWYVNPAAAPGGTGHPSLPFQTIAQAMQVASDGDQVILMDGIYTGPDNRSQNFAGRDLVVRSFTGPASCIIDLQGLGSAFLIHGAADCRVEGLTIVNGWASKGGALFLSSSTVTVANCVFDSNLAATEGGAIYAQNSRPVIEDCRFVGNGAGGGDGGGGLFLSSLDARVTRCIFEGNANRGMTARAYTAGSGTVVSHCVFDGNTSNGAGAGLYVFGGAITTPTYVLNCLFTGNSGSRGGGLAVDFVPVTVAQCTFAGNIAQQGGGGLFVDRSHPAGDVVLVNSILWGDSGGTGAAELHLLDPSARLAVDSCDVMGGQAGAFVAGGATLLWGQGNIDLDPLFESPSDWRLQLGSPCIDAADNALIPADRGDVDGDGDFAEPLPLDLDLGPRRVDVPAVPDTGNGAAPVVDMGAYERKRG